MLFFFAEMFIFCTLVKSSVGRVGKGEKVMTNGISFNVNLIAFL